MEGHEVVMLDEGWEAARAEPDTCLDPADHAALEWAPARVPGTVAAVVEGSRAGAAVRPNPDAEDWWFRMRFESRPVERGEEVVLHLDGIATVAELFVNGERVLESESMFAMHAVDLSPRIGTSNELAIRCRALGPQLRRSRKPRARWRTRLVENGNLRWLRTTMLGRAPGFAPGPAAVGPWRAVWLERRRRLAVDQLELRPRLDGADGVLGVRAQVRALSDHPPTAVAVELDGRSGRQVAELRLEREGERHVAAGELRIPEVARWWPHTHGDPVLHDVKVAVRMGSETVRVDCGRVGFRALAGGPVAGHDPSCEGLDLHVNGVPVFCRGAVWTPLDLDGTPPGGALRATLVAARDAGMNMLRIPGTGVYESAGFHDLCDELGILVWQDFMFANLDYPFEDDAFRASAEEEATGVLARLAGSASLAVLCGNSEIEQQVAMLGLDPDLGRPEFFATTLPGLARAAGADAVYLPSAPCGGDRPFRPDRGVANYYGVGGYRRPLSDARIAGVRFAAECLAFANVPDQAVIEALAPEAAAGVVVHDPRWKAGVPRDAGSGWDFDDVRDHYLAELFRVDPGELRRTDHARYLELSRAVTGELMAAVFGEWRRARSSCSGGLVLWLRDLAPGAGWGLLDHRGSPKVAYHHLRRALAPTAVWLTDEGLGGMMVHVANDGRERLSGTLRVALYHDLEQRTAEAHQKVDVAPRSTCDYDVEQLLGGFVDASWAYRFGPPAHDLMIASIEREGEGRPELVSQSVHFPAGRPAAVEPPERLGLEASISDVVSGSAQLTVSSRRLAYGVRIHAPGYVPEDDALSIEPGMARSIVLDARDQGGDDLRGSLTALNMRGSVPIVAAEAST